MVVAPLTDTRSHRQGWWTISPDTNAASQIDEHCTRRIGASVFGMNLACKRGSVTGSAGLLGCRLCKLRVVNAAFHTTSTEQ